MSRDFAITTAGGQVSVKKGSEVAVSFTVTNSTQGKITARARVAVVDEDCDLKWFSIDGDEERHFEENDTQQYSVIVKVPEDTQKKNCKFRLDVFSVENPDEVYAEGQVVELNIEAAEKKEEKKKTFPWWIVAVIAGVLCVGGIVVGVIMHNPDTPEPPKPDLGIVIPEVIGKKYQEAFNMLNEKHIIYQVFINEDNKKKIDSGIKAFQKLKSTRRMAVHNSFNLIRVAKKVESDVPVVDSTDPMPGNKIQPDKVVKLYLGKSGKKYISLTKNQEKVFVRGINKIKAEANQ